MNESDLKCIQKPGVGLV